MHVPPRLRPPTFKEQVFEGSPVFGTLVLCLLIPIIGLGLRLLALPIPTWAFQAVALGLLALVAAASGRMRTIPVALALIAPFAIGALGWLVLAGIGGHRNSDQQERIVASILFGTPFMIGVMFIATRLKPWWLRYAFAAALILLPIPISAIIGWS